MVALLFIASPLSAAPDQIAELHALRDLDRRVSDAGFRLAVSNTALCVPGEQLSGLSLHALDQYGAGFREAAKTAFGLGEHMAVLTVTAGGPAALAGIRPDDAILEIDGVSTAAPAAGKSGSYDRVETFTDRLNEALSHGHVILTAARAGQRLVITMTGAKGCGSRFQVVPGKKLNAAADGSYVQLSSALVQYARGDDELAAILAHELAHNILGHRIRLDSAGVPSGLLRNFGKNARRVRATEEEADRLSVRLMINAGYDPGAAVRFWQRFGPEHGHGILASATHPGWRKRVAILQAEIQALADPEPTSE
ncbi:M48 family metalloprotease [Allosphingosinicella indica]|uniref:Peptidase family M48 n=1 Tax=Allosphingosinicella indica TaxID=941907 RepID=A0A1X7G135_9SPHN|nr:M48 family metalloprotease [Allosphingosinicella indica]SMF62101.1 Peptidase family M48 [Allosphingosinicella indica]